MKKYILPISIVLVFVIPQMLFSHVAKTNTDAIEPAIVFTEVTADPVEANELLHVKLSGEIKQMELDDYVLGVLLGEMPAEFEYEALKAQAVAIRTYTLRRVSKQNKHDDAHICTEAACCQAFVTLEDYLNNKGSESDLQKMRSAVTETSGQVLTYNGNLIEATYFSCSGGRTEDAVDVWGTSVPYLQSVVSPGEESAAKFTQIYEFSHSQFLALLGLPEGTLLTENVITIRYTDGGGVDDLTIDNEHFSGIQLRAMLSLPSTAFSLTVTDGSVSITTKGNGHRVGMSQYGADAMAVDGSKYDEILAHYYPGTRLQIFTTNQMNAVFDKAGNL